MAFRLKVDDLHRMIYNTRLVDLKGNVTLQGIKGGGVKAYIWDGVEYLRDTTEDVFWHVNEKAPEDWKVTLAAPAVKELELLLRNFEGKANVIKGSNFIHISVDNQDDTFDQAIIDEPLPDPGEIILKSDFLVTASRYMAFSPKRFRKFPLLKPGDYPTDFYPVWHNEFMRNVLLYRCGPSVTGAITTLDRSKLYDGEGTPDYLW